MKKLLIENIAADLQTTQNELARKKYARRDVARVSLITEEVLLKYRDRFGEDVPYAVDIQKRLFSERLVIRTEAPAFDCRKGESEEEIDILRLLSTDGIRDFHWQYKNGCNIVTILLPVRKAIPDLVRVLLAVLLAVGAWFLCRALPAEANAFISDTLVPGLYDLLYDILLMIAGLLIFFTTLSGIVHLGSMEKLKSVLKQIGPRIFLNCAGIIAVYAIVLLFFADLGGTGGSFDLTEILRLLADMIPRNIFSPFITGNIMQITVLALVTGVLLLAVGENEGVAGMIKTGQRTTAYAMQYYCRFLPLLVFLNIFSVIPSFSKISLGTVIVPVSVGIAVVAVIMVLETAMICFSNRLKPSVYAKAVMPATMIGLATASTAASMDMIKKDMKTLGVDPDFTDIALPLELVFYKPFSIIIAFAGVSMVSAVFSYPLSAGTILSLSLLTLIIAFACPSVPGGMLSCLGILCTQLLLPEGSMGILILTATLFDYPGGALSVYSIQTEVAGLGFRFGRTVKNNTE